VFISKPGGFGAFNAINKTQKKLGNNLMELASGKNSLASNPASIALLNGLQSQISGLNQTNQSISYTQLSLQTAQGALSSIQSDLQNLKDLALQASNGSLSGSDRELLNTEFQQVLSNIDGTAQSTAFGDQKLLDGSFSQSVPLTPGGSSTTVNIDSASTDSLNISELDISTQEGAADALAAIDAAMESVVASQVQLGAQESALSAAASSNSVAIENLSAAHSQMGDTDYAQAMAEFHSNKVALQAQVQVLNLQNQLFKGLSEQLFNLAKKK